MRVISLTHRFPLSDISRPLAHNDRPYCPPPAESNCFAVISRSRRHLRRGRGYWRALGWRLVATLTRHIGGPQFVRLLLPYCADLSAWHGLWGRETRRRAGSGTRSEEHTSELQSR